MVVAVELLESEGNFLRVQAHAVNWRKLLLLLLLLLLLMLLLLHVCAT